MTTWWTVKMVRPKEVHVYPAFEEPIHILEADLCNCMPKVRDTSAGKMVIHRKISQRSIWPKIKAHWIH